VIEVVHPWGGFLQELSGAVAQQLMNADLDFEGGPLELGVEGGVIGF